MSSLKKEDLLKLKEQFKSTHNVLPSRFKDIDGDDVLLNKSEKPHQHSMVTGGDPSNGKTGKEYRRGTT
jgi:hypothetical protein